MSVRCYLLGHFPGSSHQAKSMPFFNHAVVLWVCGLLRIKREILKVVQNNMGFGNMNVAVALGAVSCCPEIKGSVLLPAVFFFYCACKYKFMNNNNGIPKY